MADAAWSVVSLPVPEVRTKLRAAGLVVAASGGGSGPALPAAWQAVELPASGYICPSMAALAMARGALPVFDAASGSVRIGGAVLISVKGKQFAFGGQAACDMWAAISKARVQREAELLAGMSPAAAAVMKTKRAADMAARAAGVLDNAAGVVDAAKQAAIVRESSFLAAKWAF